ncbi:hypothetical protein, partial [Aeromicrobium sp.]|uniref:hypothetical protein n=1 Tax=Aeromicrobium sp. TaxID=1871063 RepID=UPI003D6AAF66
LGRAAEAETFVKAADDALGTSRGVLLSHPLVFESGPLRNEVIPELNGALAEFRATEVPKGAADVAAEVDGAVSYLIDEVSVMADKADAGASYEFSFGSKYDDARQAVRYLATQIDGDTAEALDRVAGDEP